jgi:hypothetical protein
VVYGIALFGAISEEGDTVKPALFAVAALLSSELVWQLVKWIRRDKINNAA